MVKDLVYLTLAPWRPTREPCLDLAFEAVGADVFARHHRLRGHEVCFVAAALEQGRAVERAAYERGGTPQGLVEQWAERMLATLAALDVTHDDLVRTTEARHQRVAKALFLKLFDKGDVYKGTREGSYCARCEEFEANEAPPGTPCPACGQPLATATEAAYFFRASKYQRAVVEWLQGHRGAIQPAERGKAVLDSIAAAGVADVCISRAGHEWAIGVPIDPDHAIDSWFDALVSYLTTSDYLADPQVFERCWPPDVQVIGLEDLRVHAVAWPAVLLALGLPLPERLIVRGGLELEAAEPRRAADCAPGPLAARFGADALRHALLRSVDYAAGGRLSQAQLLEPASGPLTEGLGALVETTLGAIEGLRGGRVPRPGGLGAAEQEVAEAASRLFDLTGRLIDEFDFRGALAHLKAATDKTLRYAEAAGLAAPDGGASAARRLDTALYVLAEACRLIAHSLEPFLPGLAAEIRGRFGVETRRKASADDAAWGITQPQTLIRRGGPLLASLAPRAD